MPRGDRRQRSHKCGGFTYLWALAAIAMVGFGLAAVGPMWSEQVQREREKDLLRVGRLYAEAIDSYHRASPGVLKQYPASLDQLLLDTRHVGTVRHLRFAYRDPVDPQQPWGLVLDEQGHVRGVYSQSMKRPLRREPLEVGPVRLPVADRYSDWKFTPHSPS